MVFTRDTAPEACPGGEVRPGTPAEFADTDLIWSGVIPEDACLEALRGSTVLFYCRVDPITGDRSWWIYISDDDLSHTWYTEVPVGNYHQLTLVSCTPFLVQFGGEPNCATEECVWTWQAVCFIAGTLINTPTGQRAIESLKCGDVVYDKDLNEVTVKQLLVSTADVLMYITDARDNETGTTPEHPFLLDDARLIQAGHITAGTVLYGNNIVSAVRAATGSFTVYNLSVTGSHTFIANGYTVHNKGEE